jgi:hypothetical protein
MRRGLIIAVLLLGFLGARDAAAKDMNGRLGLGASRTLRGVQGLDVMYWVGNIGINGTGAISIGSPDVGSSTFEIALAGGALFALMTSDHADLSLGGRINLGIAKDADTQITLEAPLRIEWYPSDHFSLHGEVGIAVAIIGNKGAILSGAGALSSVAGTQFIIGGTYVTGGGGFTVYF